MNLNLLTNTVEQLHFLGYFIILLLALLESLAFFGLLIPGTIIFIFLGFLSSKGLFNIYYLVLFTTLGGILGDGISFYLGKKGFRPINEKIGVLKSNYLAKGERFFLAHGRKSIFFGRFIGPLRPIIPFVAGMLKMSLGRFFFWNILSSFAWAVTFLCLGYFFGHAWQITTIWSPRLSLVLLSFLIFLIITYYLKKIIVSKGKQTAALMKSIFNSIKQALSANQELQKLMANHPWLFKLLLSRLNKQKFSGLPLTLLSLISLYPLSWLWGIIRGVTTANLITQIDIRLENLLYFVRDPVLVKIFFWLTWLGNWQIILAGTAVFSFLLILWKRRKFLIPLWLTVIGSVLFDWLGKIFFHRPMPDDIALILTDSFSFPSGHATVAVAFYGFLTYWLVKKIKGWKAKINICFLGLVVILAIGFSRLYLGLHYLSDIAAGYLLGLLWLLLGISIVEWLGSIKPEKLVERQHRLALKIITAMIVVGVLVFYFMLAINSKPVPITEITGATKQLTSDNPFDLFNGNYSLPKYSETITASPQEPLNFIIVAPDDNQIISDFQKAGWHLAKNINAKVLLILIKAAILKQDYINAPMTPSFWNGQVNNFGIEKPTALNNINQRHHARFWKTNFRTKDGQQIYFGSASLDQGLKTSLIIHRIDPNIDAERELLFNDLSQAGVIISYTKQQLVSPQLGKNFAGDPFFTDGDVYLIYL